MLILDYLKLGGGRRGVLAPSSNPMKQMCLSLPAWWSQGSGDLNTQLMCTSPSLEDGPVVSKHDFFFDIVVFLLLHF